MPPTPETIASLDQRILNSSRRLTKLVKMDAPSVIVCNEIAMLVRKATLTYGPMVWEKIGEYMTAPVRDHYHVCRECLVGIDPEFHLCCVCQMTDDAETAELDNDADPRDDVA